MSTRACVARVTGDGARWEGVYVHHDGYPSAVGAKIWRIVQKDFVSSRNRVTPAVAIRAFCDVYITGHPCGWSIFAEECYCHEPFYVIRDRLESGAVTSDEPENLLGVEWLYLLDAQRSTLTILGRRDGEAILPPVKVATVDLRGLEPDWSNLGASSSLTPRP